MSFTLLEISFDSASMNAIYVFDIYYNWTSFAWSGHLTAVSILWVLEYILQAMSCENHSSRNHSMQGRSQWGRPHPSPSQSKCYFRFLG